MEKMRVALVTGGNKGIGFSAVRMLCERLPKNLWNVILCTRQVSAGEQALAKLKEINVPILPIVHQLDITDRASCENMKTFIQQKFGGLDLLVNNAGVAFPVHSTAPRYEQAVGTIGVNYYGTVQITEVLAPLLRDNARVVVVASLAGKRGLESLSDERRQELLSPDLTFEKIDQMMQKYIAAAKNDTIEAQGWPHSTYEMSKAGAIAAARLWAQAADKNTLNPNGAKGIFVASCCPGWCKTDMAGWEKPPLTADDGGDRVVDLCLNGGEKEQGEFLSDKTIVPLNFPQKFSSKLQPAQTWLTSSP